MANTISQSQALGNLSKLLETKQIDQNMHDYLTKAITMPRVVEYDPENPDMVARTFEVQMSQEELDQIYAQNKKELMSGSVIQFVGDSTHKDDFVRCLIGQVKSFGVLLDFTEGDQKITLEKVQWGISHAPYDTRPEVTILSKKDVVVTLKYINKLSDGIIQAEIVG